MIGLTFVGFDSGHGADVFPAFPSLSRAEFSWHLRRALLGHQGSKRDPYYITLEPCLDEVRGQEKYSS